LDLSGLRTRTPECTGTVFLTNIIQPTGYRRQERFCGALLRFSKKLYTFVVIMP
jgi:hypothetical protein